MSESRKTIFKASYCSSCAKPKSKCTLDSRAHVSGSLACYIVEDHNEVLPYIYRAIGSKTLPFSNGVIVHFDSHPDLMIPSKFDCSRIHDKEYVFSSLSIENWILPAVFAKHISAICWIKPPWANQLVDGLNHFKIGCHTSSKEIKVTCPQAYFVGELAWAKEEDLEQTSDVILDIVTLGNNDEGCKNVNTADNCTPACKKPKVLAEKSNLSDEFMNAVNSKPYVLDIDLDFFSTHNPFLGMFNSESLSILSNLCHYDHPGDNADEASLGIATQKRQLQLTELQTAFIKMNNSADVHSQNNDKVAKLFEMLKSGNCTTDPEFLLGAGCTCEECALPHHVSSHKEIHNLLKITEELLRTLPKPSIVTISRSTLDDYCPSEDVDFIQQGVLDMLRRLYASLDLHYDYEDNTM